MTTRDIEKLSDEVRDAIDATVVSGERHANGAPIMHSTDEARVLRDYVRDMGHTDAYADLIAREMTHERRHQSARPDSVPRPRLTTRARALVVLLHNIGEGAKRPEMPAATMFIQCRDTAAEAYLIGYLARVVLLDRPELLAKLERCDYAAEVRR